MSRAVALAGGETIPVPEALETAIDAATRASLALRDDVAASRTAFVDGLIRSLFDQGFVLAPTSHDASQREMVTMNVYTGALARQHAVERRLQTIAAITGPGDGTADLLAEFEGVIEALTGHAPPTGAARLTGVEERLRQIRLKTHGIPLDVPAKAVPLIDPEKKLVEQLNKDSGISAGSPS